MLQFITHSVSIRQISDLFGVKKIVQAFEEGKATDLVD